jgi:F0F1-type ATP synthase assembly protein I
MIKNLLEQDENQPSTESKPDELQNKFKREFTVEENNQFINSEQFGKTADEEIKIQDSLSGGKKEETIFQVDFKPESKAETIRKSGLAYAAAITLFGAIVFMLILGWFFDLLVGTSPWGMIGGIILGAVIGFFQFFRLTSQIINNKK